MLISKSNLVTTFIDLLKIDSISSKEENIRQYVIEKLQKLSIDEILTDTIFYKNSINCGNIFTRIRGDLGDHQSFLLACHLDTVSSTEKLKIVTNQDIIKSEGNTILGADDKSGVAIILEILRVIKEMKIPTYDIELLFTVLDEPGFVGLKQFDNSKVKSQYGFVLDAPQLELHYGANCLYYFDIIIKEKEFHIINKTGNSINLVQLALKFLNEICFSWIDENTSIIYSLLEGESSKNRETKQKIIRGEIRSISENYAYALLNYIEKKLMKIANSEVNYQFKYEKIYGSFNVKDNSTFINHLKVTAEKLDIPFDFKFAFSRGGTMASLLNEYGINSVSVGTGMDNFHSTSEFINTKHMEDTANFILEIIQKSIGGSLNLQNKFGKS